MLGGPVEGGPPCWLLVGDVGFGVGWWLVGWLVAVGFFSVEKSKKVHTNRFLPPPFPFPSTEHAEGFFFGGMSEKRTISSA